MNFEAGEALGPGRSHIIKRPRLTRLLDETTARIVLLVAPAGYGKTTLAREWLSTRPHVWYRGTEAIRDVAALAGGLAKAASQVVPGAEKRLEMRLRASSTPQERIDELAELLGQDLRDWPTTSWMIFDDYQFACDSEPAERFVDRLLSSCPLQLLIASRSRPRWATARRLLYGDISELGQGYLAMSQTESSQILAGRRTSETEGLIALTDGWPALLGLAAQADDLDLPLSGLPDELYAYFAEELYQAATPATQEGLRRLSLAQTVTPNAEALIGENFSFVVSEGMKLGFFLATSRERMELHPLLRSFLKSKFLEKRDATDSELVKRLVDKLIDSGQLDEAFQLIDEFFDERLLIKLLETAIPRILDEGRLPTLRHWVATALAHQADSPVVDYADAEIAFRKGEQERAEILALQANHRLQRKHPLTSRTLYLAGVSAHRMSRDAQALDHFRQAETTACSKSDAQRALWGRFITTASLEQDEVALGLLAEFERRSDVTIDDQLRVAGGRLLMASSFGGVGDVLESVESLAQIVNRSHDPLNQTAFLNLLAGSSVANGRYEAALRAALSETAIAETYGLAFVIPIAQSHLAGAQMGLRKFRACRASLLQASGSASVGRDEFLLMNIGALWARLRLIHGAFEEALNILELHQLPSSTPGMEGELLALRSLVLACASEDKLAIKAAETAEAMTRRIEVTALTTWTRAVVAMESRSQRSVARAGFSMALESGNIDAFVTAYRACPRLLELLAENETNHEQLKIILERARDHALAESVGLRLPSAPEVEGPSILSKREREVLQLVIQGLTNKDIGRTLFITEGTAKVHVRKICKKFGVRTRTEAAMRAAELSD
jgi:LuxR family maltose regulon positive regulatory protein